MSIMESSSSDGQTEMGKSNLTTRPTTSSVVNFKPRVQLSSSGDVHNSEDTSQESTPDDDDDDEMYAYMGKYRVSSFPAIEYEQLLEGKIIFPDDDPRAGKIKSIASTRGTPVSSRPSTGRQNQQHLSSQARRPQRKEDTSIVLKVASQTAAGLNNKKQSVGTCKASNSQNSSKPEESASESAAKHQAGTPSEGTEGNAEGKKGAKRETAVARITKRTKESKQMREMKSLVRGCTYEQVSMMGNRKVPLHHYAECKGTPTAEQLRAESTPVRTQGRIYQEWLLVKQSTLETAMRFITAADLVDIHQACPPGQVAVPLQWKAVANRFAGKKGILSTRNMPGEQQIEVSMEKTSSSTKL